MPSYTPENFLSALKHKEEIIKLNNSTNNLCSEVYLEEPPSKPFVKNSYARPITMTSENTASGIRTSSEALIVEIIGMQMNIIHQFDSISVVDIQTKIERLLQDNPKKKYIVITDWLTPTISVILK